MNLSTRRFRAVVAVLVSFGLVAAGALLVVARSQAITLITSHVEQRGPLDRTPDDLGLSYADVKVTSRDGLALAGWELPSRNGAVVMLQHGYKVNRAGRVLDIAEMLNRHGFGVLLTTIRAHDLNGGDQITFGREEMQDLDAWYAHLRGQSGGDSLSVGAFGNSMGGSLMIQFAAQNEDILAVVAHSAFSSLLDTVNTSVRSFTGLPPFPFAPLIRFWVEREWGFDASTIDFTEWVGDISPRPVLLMQGGADRRISPESGELLLEAAGDPKELWFDPELGHAVFHTERPAEFERRVVEFFERHLLPAPSADVALR